MRSQNYPKNWEGNNQMKCLAVTLPETVSAALLVIGGYYGNGEERKTKLKSDGFDYNKVQKCVNELYPIIKKYER